MRKWSRNIFSLCLIRILTLNIWKWTNQSLPHYTWQVWFQVARYLPLCRSKSLVMVTPRRDRLSSKIGIHFLATVHYRSSTSVVTIRKCWFPHHTHSRSFSPFTSKYFTPSQKWFLLCCFEIPVDSITCLAITVVFVYSSLYYCLSLSFLMVSASGTHSFWINLEF